MNERLGVPANNGEWAPRRQKREMPREGEGKNEEDGWMDVRYMLPQKGLQVFHQRRQRKNREKERGALK